jgi:hypothetical protein
VRTDKKKEYYMRRIRTIIAALWGIFPLIAFAHAQQVPELLPVPVTLDARQQEELGKRKSQLEAQWYNLVLKVNDHNRKCNKVPANTPLANECRQRMNSLQGEIAAHIEGVKSFNQALADAVQRRTSIDQIYVPPPPPENLETGPFDWQKVIDGYYLGTGIGEDAAQWYADRYVETASWYGKAAYGAGGLAASLWTPDTYLETASTLALAGEADMARRMLLKAASGPKHVFLSADEFANIDINAKNIIYHIKYSDGYVKELPWRVPARIIGPASAPEAVAARAASGPPKHVFLSADEFANIDINAKNMIYHIRHPDGVVKTMEWFVNR